MGLSAISGPSFSGFAQLQSTRQINTNLASASLPSSTSTTNIRQPEVQNGGNVQRVVQDSVGQHLDLFA